ncbi:MAG TPA: immunoglobulin domain-containing protein [Verrucomicrobiae bacterium]
MRLNVVAIAASGLLLGASYSSSGWNFAVWPGPDASQWAPALGLTNVVGIAGGTDHTMFIRGDGSIVWSWGGSWAGPANAVKVSAYCHDLALLADSTPVEWGLGGCAGSAPYTTMPPGLRDITAIAAGDRHSLVLKSDGTCVSWGWMTVGTGQAFVPDGLSNVVAIAAGFDISSALKSDGSVVAWGDPEYGGTAAPGGLTDGVAIAMGHHHGLVLRSNGTVVAWGTAPPPGLTNISKIAAQQTWSLLLKQDGHLLAWNDGVGSQHNVPTQPLTNVLDISAGSYHGVVLVGDGPPQPLWNLSNQVVIAGGSVTFTGEALGTEPLSYQWLFNGIPVQGAATPTLALTNILPAQAGTYAVVSSNAFGVLTNSGGSLTVLPFLTITDPTNATLFGGDTFLNSITVEGPDVTYQWRHDGADLPGQTTALLVVPNITTNETGGYTVVVSNVFGRAESSVATLTVVPISVTSQPTDRSAYVGESTTFFVDAWKSGPFSYQWRHDGADLPGETNQSLTLTNLTLQQAGPYSVLVSNPYGSIESSNALLSVVDSAPALTSQPRDVVTWRGGSASFQVNATGSKPLSYQWRFNGNDLSGATDSAFAINNVTTNNVGSYSVTVSNALGKQVSQGARLALVPVVLWPTEMLSLMPLSPALSNTVAVSAGGAFSLALRADGAVVAWGANDQRQTNVPPGLGNVAAVAAGDAHCLALRSNGTVVAWGSNTYGQTNVPVNLSNVVAIAATDLNSMALRSDGTAVAWGRIDYARSTGAVPGMDWNGITAIAAGQFHRLGLRQDGTVAGWLDYSDYNLNRVPAGLSNVVAVAAASRHSLALKADGSVLAWGDTLSGLANIPAGLSNVVGIACGLAHNLALKADGTVVGWGFTGGYGLTNPPPTQGALAAISAGGHNLGLLAASDPAIVRSPRSVAAPPLQPVLLSVGAVSARPLSYQWQLNGQNIAGATDTFYRIPAVSQANQGDYRVVVSNELGAVTSATARLNVAGVIAWGWNGFRQTNVPAGLNATAVGGGYGHSLALRGDGRIVAWGIYGTQVTNVPAAATNVVQLGAGPYHNLALRTDGKVVAWGSDSSQVSVPASLSNVVAVSAGGNDSLALKSDGTVVHFGTYSPPPPWLSNVVAISAGEFFKMALRSDGSVITWSALPPPAGLSNVVAVAAASAAAAALRSDGTVVSWGSTPLPPPPDLTNVVAIAAGGNHLLALKSDGTVVAWGTNSYGQASAPPGWTNVAAVAGGSAHSLILIDNRDPLIVRQPASARAWSGNQVLFSAGARSGLPLQFQWQCNGTNLPGATNSWLLLPQAEAADAGLYSLLASNALGSVSSSAASLAVFDQPPFIRKQPANVSVSSSSPAVFQVIAEGSEPKQYQWRKDGSSIDSATTATLSLSNLTRADEGLYSVVVSNAFGSVTSSAASLRVMVPQRLQTPVLNPDGSVALVFSDSDGGLLSAADLPHFEVDSTTNLLDWEILTNALTLTNGMLWYSDEASTNYPQRFYRVRENP